MDISNYNLKRHIQLLNHEKNLISQNKYLFTENNDEFWELNKYNAVVAEHIFWEDRFEVVSLIQNFLTKNIDCYKFHDNIFAFRSNYLNQCRQFLSKLASEEIKDFLPNKESYKLKGFLTSLYAECEAFELDWDEKTLYNNIREIHFEFQKILNKE